MASESLQLDDVMATMMSMGFEFKDCQEAITNGKLTVQAAIDWILAGKPGNVVQPSLKLNTDGASGPLGNTSNNPFVSENVQGMCGPSSIVSSSSDQAMGVDISSDTVVSRSHLSDKQQQIKHDFEEKERQEAKRKAQEEKRKKKQDKERILKEIQEDREKLRLTKQAKVEPSVPPTAPTQASTSGSAIASEKQSENTSIQVRLPNGQMFRQTFSPTSTLNAVWDAVYVVIKSAMNSHSGFIQPFPRREFTREEMGQTLQALGLVPSGSLVLKKKDVQQASATPMEIQSVLASRSDQDMEQPVEASGRMDAEGEDDPMEGMELRGGPGFRLDDRPAAEGQEADWEEDDENEGTFNLHQAGPPGDPLDIPGLEDHPILGQNQLANGRRNQHVFAGWGNRLVPEGVPGEDQHLNRRAGEMAAEAAAQRFAQQGPVPPQDPPQPSSSSEQAARQRLPCIRTLQYMSMSVLAKCLSDPRKPFVTLSGLPEELLQMFLRHLMKEGLLKPRLMQMIPSYLLKLVCDCYPYTTNELLHSARIFPHLHTLSLKACQLITDAGLNSIRALTALKVINLSHCKQITDHCFSIFSGLPALHSVILEGTKITDSGLIQFAQSAACPRISHLDLTSTSITQSVFPFLQVFTKLKSLYLKECNITGLAGVEGIVSLETLDLSETQILTDSVLCLTRLLCLKHVSLSGTQSVQGDRALSYLKDLKLTAIHLPERSSTTDLGMQYISGFCLSALDLTNYTNVGDGGMKAIGQMLSLKKLLLTNTKVSDIGVQHLPGLVNLEVLYLDKTCVSNASATVIACLKNLCELSLSATSITSDFLKQGELNKCINLTKLNLSRTIIGDKGIACLSLPYLELLNLDCTRVHSYVLPDIQKTCPNLRSVAFASLSTLPEDQGEDD